MYVSTHYVQGSNSFISNAFSTFNKSFLKTTFKENYIGTPDGDETPYISFAFLIDP